MSNVETVFEVRDVVYDSARYGKGVVREIGDISTGSPVVVVFGLEPCYKILRYTLDGRCGVGYPPSLSFVPYDLINGGFTQDRSKIPIEVDTLVYVRDSLDKPWEIRFFSHFDKYGNVSTFTNQSKSKENKGTVQWVYHSLKNPLEDDEE